MYCLWQERRCTRMETFTLTPRTLYMEKIFRVLNNDNITIVAGVRRAGKSCIAKQLEGELRKRYTNGEQIVRYNFETVNAKRLTGDDLIEGFNRDYISDKQNFILLDELTHIDDWEKAINYFCEYANCKIILFSSNRRIISSDLRAVRDGKFDLIHALPLSLPEFMIFQGFQETTPEKTPLLEKRYCRFDERSYTLEEIYKCYITYGGLPIMKPEYMDIERARTVTDGSYGAIVTRDILELGSTRESSAVTDPLLLRSVISIMADSIGDSISATWIGKQTANYLKRPSSTKTVESYIRALLNAQLFYIAEPFDIRLGQVTKAPAKYYVVDAALHNYMTGIRAEDENRMLENKVFFELLRHDYYVYTGRLGKEKVSFMAQREKEKVYVQVAANPGDENMDALVNTLRKIRDNHPKLIISFGHETQRTDDGLLILNALDFLMGYSWSPRAK